MPFKFPYSMIKPDFFVMMSDIGEPLVSIKNDGTVQLSQNLQKDEQAVAFWSNIGNWISDTINLDKVETGVLLVKSYNLLKSISEDVVLSVEKRTELNKLMERFSNHMLR